MDKKASTDDSQSAKQQLLERIKSASNILVTVSTNPSVDELSAALGLTIMLNKLEKHATAVVSGEIPPAISFLDPEKTFENSVDSLRDFIIALDKEKADHLRYKVDGDVVKIFITPYKTTITQDDLDFSQGDYNVDLVMALGVQDKEHLDTALSAHGRILHDATVATLSCGEDTSDLGSIDWNEPNASSLSEMLVALSESIKNDNPLLDEQSASALLTGIVAATDRFSNNRTSSKVMTMAAQLMAAGANQQLIASKLQESHEISPEKSAGNDDGTTDLNEGQQTKVKKDQPAKKPDGELDIEHEEADETSSDDVPIESQPSSTEDQLAKDLETVAGASPSVDDLKKDLESANAELESDAEKSPPAADAILPPVSRPEGEIDDTPSMGGVLNATTEQAEKDKEAEANNNQNHTILTHTDGDYVGDQQPTFQAPFNAADNKEEPSSVDIFKDAKPSVDLTPPSGSVPTAEPVAPPDLSAPLPPPPVAAPEPAVPPMPEPAQAPGVDRAQEHQDAQAAVAAAFDAAPFDPANNPTVASGAQQLGEVPHDAPLPPAPSLVEPPLPPAAPTTFEPLPPPPMPDTPPLPPAPTPSPAPADFNVLPPPPAPAPGQFQGALPPEQLGQIFGASGAPAPSAVPEPAPNDPNQFKIPGQ